MKLKGTRALSVYDATTQKLSAIDVSEDDIVYAAGGDSVLVYLKDANDFPEYNTLYRQYFTEPFPARTTISNCLGKVLFEIDVVAYVGS